MNRTKELKLWEIKNCIVELSKLIDIKILSTQEQDILKCLYFYAGCANDETNKRFETVLLCNPTDRDPWLDRPWTEEEKTILDLSDTEEGEPW